MIRLVAYTAQAAVLALVAYNGVTAFWGWPNRSIPPAGPRRRPIRVVIPAHDEAGVVAGLVADLNSSGYEAAAIWVVADRCRDETAAVAAGAGANVAVRTEGPAGKGSALAWYLERHPLEPGEALLVLDADNRVPPHLLGMVADELDAGNRVVQCYLDVTNADDSVLSLAGALSYWAGNRMVQLARTNLGWSADLGGTGMALTREALDGAGGFGASVTEDQELAARLALAGERVVWLHEARLRDEKPAGLAATLGQRTRWMAGKRQVARRYAIPMLRRAVATRSMGLADQVIRLVQPGRSFVAVLSGVMAVVAVATGSRYLLPAPVWIGATAVQFAEPIPFLLRDGIPARYVARYPVLVVLGALWIPIRVLSRARSDWFHTPHRGVIEPGSDAPVPGP